jgi:hypothetical protein
MLILVYSSKGKGTFALQEATKAQKGSTDIAVLFFNLGARWGVWSIPRPGRFTPGKDPVPIGQEVGWASWTVWTVAKNLASSW